MEMLQRELAHTFASSEKEWRNYRAIFLPRNQSLKFMTLPLGYTGPLKSTSQSQKPRGKKQVQNCKVLLSPRKTKRR